MERPAILRVCVGLGLAVALGSTSCHREAPTQSPSSEAVIADAPPNVEAIPALRDPKGYVEPTPPEPEPTASVDRGARHGDHDRDRDGDRIADVDDACPDEPETVNGMSDEDGCPDGCRLPVTPPVAVELSFERGAQIPPEGRAALRDLAEQLSAQGATRVTIEGHTDGRGSAEANERLARRRAQAVRALLIDGGLAAEVLEIVVYGEQRPRADNITAQGRQRNRRVTIICAEGC